MPANDREVFQFFGSDPDTMAEVDYLAYALYSRDKYDWVSHFQKKCGRFPTLDEENAWIADLPDSRLNEIRETAYTVFVDAARSFMEDEIEEERKIAVNSSILSEINNHMSSVLSEITRYTSFAKNFWQNIFVGIVASFAFAAIIIFAGLIFAKDPSPIALYKKVVPGEAGPAAP